jgi:hypothetical protein
MDVSLATAAGAFAGATAFGGAVAVATEAPCRPLGLAVPGSPAVQLGTGLGTGLSAPWPLAAGALWQALLGDPESPLPGRVCAIAGAAGLLDTLVQPSTWRPHSFAAAAAAGLGVLTSSALLTAGVLSARAAARKHLPSAGGWSGTTAAPATPDQEARRT